MSKKDPRHGFLKKILYTYLAVLIIPLILLNIIVFKLMIDHAKELDLKYSHENLARIKSNLEEEIYRLELISIDIKDSLLIRSSVLSKNPNKIREAQQFLKSYNVANQFISDVIYYPRDGQILYGSGSVYSLDTYTKYFLAVPGVSQYDVFKKINSLNNPHLIKWTNNIRGEKSLNFHYVFPLEKTTGKDSSLIFLITYNEMSRLMGIDKDPPNEPLFLRDSQNRIIYDYIPPGQEEALDAFLNRQDDKYIFIDNDFSDQTWMLTTMIQKKSFTSNVKKAFILTALLSLVVLFMEFLIIRFALKLTYNPLKHLAETLAPEEPVDNVLHSLQEGVHKLQTTGESVLKKMQREDLIGSLLHLSLSDDSDVMLQNKATALGFSPNDVFLAAVIIDLGEQTLAGDSELIDAYYETLTEILSFPLTGWYEPVTGRFFCIIQTDDRNTNKIQSTLEEVCEQLFEEFAMEGRVCLGGIKTDYSHLRNSLDEALMNSSALSQKDRQELSYFEEHMNDIREPLQKGDQQRTIMVIENLYNRAPSAEMVGYITFRCFNIITGSLPDLSQETWRKQHSLQLEALPGSEKKSYVIDLAKECIEILGHVNQLSVIKASRLKELEKYINENYLSPEFSVSRTAENFNMSISAVSLLFKKHRGYGIAAYVGNARVEKAKELLKKGNSVNDVVNLVGYSDTTSFIKKFKKITGRTPGEYIFGLMQ